LRILYRADGGHPIGTGHIFRAKRLLEALAHRVDLDAVLLTAEEPTALRIAVGVNARIEILPPRRDTIAVKPRLEGAPVVDFVSSWRPDVVVIDMLDTPGPDMEAISRTGVPIVTFDDRGEGRFFAHTVVNVLVAETEPDRLQRATRLLEGPAYAVLDPLYAEAHATGADRLLGASRHVFVATGGGDAAGLTVKVADALQLVPELDCVEFACGPAFPHRVALDEVLRQAPWAHAVRTELPSLLDCYRSCDLALIAGGLTMYEVCSVGTPALAVCQPIDHQFELAEFLSEAGAMATVGYGLLATNDQIAAAVRSLMDDVCARRRMCEVGPKLVDGRGTERVADTLAAIAI
jgi:spore coat polysaccharide biosynthesis predicted glycosyltransferase SpsG